MAIGQGRPGHSSCIEGGGEYGEQLEGVIWLDVDPVNAMVLMLG